MTGPTTIHLVRHATHGLLPHTLAGRMPGVELDGAGQAQAAALAERFAGSGTAAVLTSPVRRARQTAAPIAARLGLEPAIEPGLEEIDFGAWTGLTFAVLARDPAWRHWNELRSLAACPGGETMHQAQSRALTALHRVRAAYGTAAVIAVSHADIIKSVLAAALGLPLDHLQRFAVDPASVSTLVLADGFVRVEAVNRI